MLRTTLVVLFMLLVPWLANAQAGARVENVLASTAAQSNLPPLVAERMNHSIAAIAGQLMEGKEIAAVQAEQTAYEHLIQSNP